MSGMRTLVVWLAVCAVLGCARTPPVPSPPADPEPDQAAYPEQDSTWTPPADPAPVESTPAPDPGAPAPGAEVTTVPPADPAVPPEPAAAEPARPPEVPVQPARRRAPPPRAPSRPTASVPPAPPPAPDTVDKPAPSPRPAPAPAYAGPEPCQVALRGDSPVARACQQGGLRAAKTAMKDLIRRARSNGVKHGCDDCHKSETDYTELTSDAKEKFASLVAAAK
jgi:hypothetical protein